MAAPPPSYEEAQGYAGSAPYPPTAPMAPTPYPQQAPSGQAPYPQQGPYPTQPAPYTDASKGYPMPNQMPYPAQPVVTQQYPYGAPGTGFNGGHVTYPGQVYTHPTAVYNPQGGVAVQNYQPMVVRSAADERRKRIIIIICIVVFCIVGFSILMRLIF